MVELGTLITISKNIYKTLQPVYQLSQSEVFKDIKDWQSNLDNLKSSVSKIENLLLVLDAKPELSLGEQAWVKELTEVLYEADDLFDEVLTIAKTKEPDEDEGLLKKVLDEVSRFFSCMNCILVKYKASREVKSIERKLDVIARDHARYGVTFDPHATLNRKVETCSFINETHENIIGRDADMKVVIDMLSDDPNVVENVGFVVIVGIGGLGKTTLARLVYKDKVTTKFNKKIWACVSDQDRKGFNVKEILAEIVELPTNNTMQSIQKKFQEELKNKVYLLILDNVWTEDPNEWCELSKYLTIGGRGSRVVITTRSEDTADMILGSIAHSKKHMLKGLSNENSWRLFVFMAFEPESDELDDPELTTICEEIVKKCSNVPLAINVIGRLLRGQEHKREVLENNLLPQTATTNNTIMSILKLSYNNLAPSVKNCFRYCALYPKGFVMNKLKLTSLWMAQGYIGDSEDPFLILLKRCFFQDVVRNMSGDIIYFKMHDLMHDLAHEVAGDEIIRANTPPNNLSKKVRHVFIHGQEWTESSFHERNIRTCYMNTEMHSNVVKSIVAHWRFLRSLRLDVPDAQTLPESVGELLHLRYLDLSQNYKLETLPNSISKLYNLQSLILQRCFNLKEWPKDFCKLVNLRLLDISGCLPSTCMPLGIGQLTNLHDLTNFNVEKQFGAQLKDLKFLVNLRGKLVIAIDRNLGSEMNYTWDGGYLEHIKNLKEVEMRFGKDLEPNNEALIEKLQPNRNLMKLTLFKYNGTEIPRWGRPEDDWAIILPNLVKIELYECESLHGLPLLSNLKHLKSLDLETLNNLEYMEFTTISRGSCGSKDLSFFPSLEYLRIWDLKRLKGWWREVGEGDSSSMPHWQPPFPRLSKLTIQSCPELTSLPPCPALEFLEVSKCNKSLRILPGHGPANLDTELRVKVDSVGYLTTLPARHLTDIEIFSDGELERLSEIEEIFKSFSSLRKLKIAKCTKLTSVSGVLEHLTALESLELVALPALVIDPDDDMPWRSLRHNLRSLTLSVTFANSQQTLPRGMQHLTALQNLSIGYCESLKCLPEWISCLSSLHSLTIDFCTGLKSLSAIQTITSLQKLEILYCPYLREACKELSGKEWSNIQHIPHISYCSWGE